MSFSFKKKLTPGAEDQPLNRAERDVLREVKRALGKDVAGLPRDMIVQFVRGYENEPRWAETTIGHIRDVTQWRDREGCARVLQPEHVPDKRAEFERMWKSGSIGRDPTGHPIVVECIGRIPPAEFKAAFTEELFLRHCVYNKETLRRLCVHHSHEVGRRVYKFVAVLDLDGLSMAHTSSHFVHLVKTYISAFSNYYPESLLKLYIINSPWIFNAMWKIIRPMLHPLTAQKIKIFPHGPAAAKAMADDGLQFDQPLAGALAHPEACSHLVQSLDLVRTGEEPLVPEAEVAYHDADADDPIWQEALPGDADPIAEWAASASSRNSSFRRLSFKRATPALEVASPSSASAAEARVAGAMLSPARAAASGTVTGTLDGDVFGKRPAFFALTGRDLSWWPTEEQLNAALQGDMATASNGPTAPRGALTLKRVHGGAKYVLLVGDQGQCLCVRRSTGTALIELATARLAGREANPAIGAGEWVDLAAADATAERAREHRPGEDVAGAAVASAVAGPSMATAASADAAAASGSSAGATKGSVLASSALGATRVVPAHEAAPVSSISGSGLPAPLVLALALALCAANVAVLGQWRLELTWDS